MVALQSRLSRAGLDRLSWTSEPYDERCPRSHAKPSRLSYWAHHSRAHGWPRLCLPGLKVASLISPHFRSLRPEASLVEVDRLTVFVQRRDSQSETHDDEVHRFDARCQRRHPASLATTLVSHTPALDIVETNRATLAVGNRCLVPVGPVGPAERAKPATIPLRSQCTRASIQEPPAKLARCARADVQRCAVRHAVATNFAGDCDGQARRRHLSVDGCHAARTVGGSLRPATPLKCGGVHGSKIFRDRDSMRRIGLRWPQRGRVRARSWCSARRR